MAATELLSDVPNPPGINIEGLPTIDVCGHEVSIEALAPQPIRMGDC